MGKKRGENQLWVIIAGLILLNCLTVAYFLMKQENTQIEEIVATVGKEEITKQDWLDIMEKRYGKDTLKELIDQQVIEALAKKYKIKVSDKAIEREMLLLRTIYGVIEENETSTNDWKEQIESTLLLEEILTRDVNIPEEEIKAYYEENISLYTILPSYHVSEIVVHSIDEANQVEEELTSGSQFTALATEKSIDEDSASQGGDIGYIRSEDKNFPAEYMKAIETLKPGEWSSPIHTDKGYVIAMLHEKIEGKDYSYDEVKQEIRRLIALDQMKEHTSVDALWDEVNVEWYYGKNNKE